MCVARATFRTLYDDGIMKKKLSQKMKKKIVKKKLKKCNVNINSDIWCEWLAWMMQHSQEVAIMVACTEYADDIIKFWTGLCSDYFEHFVYSQFHY